MDSQREAYALTCRVTERPYGPQEEASLLDSLAEEAAATSRADSMSTQADLAPAAPAPADARQIAVRTSLGTLRAEVVEGEDGYPGISVVLERDDGSSGIVSLTEVCEADVVLDGSRPRLQTHSYDGVAEEPVTVECDPDGPWMSEFPSPELPRQDADRPRAPFTPEMVFAAVRDRPIGYGMATEVARRLNATAEEAFLESLPLRIDDDAIAAVVAQVVRGTSLDRFADSKTEEASPPMRPAAGSAPLPGDGLR